MLKFRLSLLTLEIYGDEYRQEKNLGTHVKYVSCNAEPISYQIEKKNRGTHNVKYVSCNAEPISYQIENKDRGTHNVKYVSCNAEPKSYQNEKKNEEHIMRNMSAWPLNQYLIKLKKNPRRRIFFRTIIVFAIST